MNKTTLVTLTDHIIKWGLQTPISSDTGLDELRKNLAALYTFCLSIEYPVDEGDYVDSPDYDYNVIRENVMANLPDFGYYYTLSTLNPHQEPELLMGDAIDDLADIVSDLLEAKWRLENNGEPDALWFLEISFISHLEQHILDLLNYIRNV
jgi:hypothetical protein